MSKKVAQKVEFNKEDYSGETANLTIYSDESFRCEYMRGTVKITESIIEDALIAEVTFADGFMLVAVKASKDSNWYCGEFEEYRYSKTPQEAAVKLGFSIF